MVYRQVLMYGLMLGVISCTGDRTEPSASITDEQSISADETSSANEISSEDEISLADETSLMDETSSMEETSLVDETSSMEETSLVDETSSMEETSLVDETSSMEETSLVDETSLASEEESVPSAPRILFQELRLSLSKRERVIEREVPPWLSERVGFKEFIGREVPFPEEFLDPSESTRLLEGGREFLSQEEVTAFISKDETTPSETEDHLTAGIAHYEQGNYLRAIEFFQDAVERRLGDLGRAYHYLGLAYFAQQDYEQAIQNYDEAIERGVIEAYRQRGNAYSSIGNFRQANEDYTAYQRLSQ